MNFLRKNCGWIIVVVLASLPLIPVLSILDLDFSNGMFELSVIGYDHEEKQKTAAMLYHISGEFSIRWMTAVLTLTPFYILFGVTNLYVRQAMGIATAVWSFIHFIFFIWVEGFLQTFTQVNYIVGFLAIVILIPLFFTSNRKAMKRLKRNWKKLQRFAYAVVLLSLLHVAILDKTWLVYAVVVGLGLLIRTPIIKGRISKLRLKKK